MNPGGMEIGADVVLKLDEGVQAVVDGNAERVEGAARLVCECANGVLSEKPVYEVEVVAGHEIEGRSFRRPRANHAHWNGNVVVLDGKDEVGRTDFAARNGVVNPRVVGDEPLAVIDHDDAVGCL